MGCGQNTIILFRLHCLLTGYDYSAIKTKIHDMVKIIFVGSFSKK